MGVLLGVVSIIMIQRILSCLHSGFESHLEALRSLCLIHWSLLVSSHLFGRVSDLGLVLHGKLSLWSLSELLVHDLNVRVGLGTSLNSLSLSSVGLVEVVREGLSTEVSLFHLGRAL